MHPQRDVDREEAPRRNQLVGGGGNHFGRRRSIRIHGEAASLRHACASPRSHCRRCSCAGSPAPPMLPVFRQAAQIGIDGCQSHPESRAEDARHHQAGTLDLVSRLTATLRWQRARGRRRAGHMCDANAWPTLRASSRLRGCKRWRSGRVVPCPAGGETRSSSCWESLVVIIHSPSRCDAEPHSDHSWGSLRGTICIPAWAGACSVETSSSPC